MTKEKKEVANMSDNERTIESLRKALAFYADTTHHEPSQYDRENDTFESAVERDGGYRAREALKEVGGI